MVLSDSPGSWLPPHVSKPGSTCTTSLTLSPACIEPDLEELHPGWAASSVTESPLGACSLCQDCHGERQPQRWPCNVYTCLRETGLAPNGPLPRRLPNRRQMATAPRAAANRWPTLPIPGAIRGPHSFSLVTDSYLFHIVSGFCQ